MFKALLKCTCYRSVTEFQLWCEGGTNCAAFHALAITKQKPDNQARYDSNEAAPPAPDKQPQIAPEE